MIHFLRDVRMTGKQIQIHDFLMQLPFFLVKLHMNNIYGKERVFVYIDNKGVSIKVANVRLYSVTHNKCSHIVI